MSHIEFREPNLWDYVSIARPDHWVKHVFIVPGILAAMVLVGFSWSALIPSLMIGLASACAIASANYVINEWLDAEFDRHHPLKFARPGAAGRLSARIVYAEYAGLGVTGLVLAYFVSPLFLATSAVFLVSGVTYNVRPLRTKERAFLDVLSEAINNPIRLILGWSMVSAMTVPPISLLITYWFGGAFLMVTKRLAEYRFIASQPGGREKAALYRASFAQYTEHTLTLSAFLYAILSAFFLAVFLIKYRSEYILVMPLIAGLFTYYLHLGLMEQSITQTPEKLYTSRGLLLIVGLLGVSVGLLTFIDVPMVEAVARSRFTEINIGP